MSNNPNSPGVNYDPETETVTSESAVHPLDGHKFISYPDELTLTFRGDEVEFMLNVFHRLNEQMQAAQSRQSSRQHIAYLQGLAESAALVYDNIMQQIKASKANEASAN